MSTPSELRAAAVASFRYRLATEEHRGCKDGFLDGLAGTVLESVRSISPGYLDGYLVGHDVGVGARQNDHRSNQTAR